MLRICGVLSCRADALTRVRGEVLELKNVMVDNIEKASKRWEVGGWGWKGHTRSMQWIGGLGVGGLGWWRWCTSHLAGSEALTQLLPWHADPSWMQVLGRGERLELLVEKTDSLGQQAFAFKRQVRRGVNGSSTWLRWQASAWWLTVRPDVTARRGSCESGVWYAI